MTLRSLLHWLRMALAAFSWWWAGCPPSASIYDRTFCTRCGLTGREHATDPRSCLWFRPPLTQSNGSWCPGCKDDLVSQGCHAIGVDAEGAEDDQYFCRCGTWSRWRCDVMPSGFLVEHRRP